MPSFRLDIVTPLKELNFEDVTYLRAPGLDGLFGVMAGHTDAIFAIDVGEVKVTRKGENVYFATSGGFAEVTGDRVQLLVEAVERPDEIDVTRAQAAAARAKKLLSSRTKDINSERAHAALSRAINRLHVAPGSNR